MRAGVGEEVGADVAAEPVEAGLAVVVVVVAAAAVEEGVEVAEVVGIAAVVEAVVLVVGLNSVNPHPVDSHLSSFEPDPY